MKENEILKKQVSICLCAMVYTAILALSVCYFGKYEPFGNNSMVEADAVIQYIDLFAYLKELLEGNQALEFSFSKTLGGRMIAVFAYYLSSPCNLIVTFFKKENLYSFYTIVGVLKIVCASGTCALFLLNRFPKMRRSFTILLSISYGLMQYNIGQYKNIMWLDGVYMLPLVLLGIYRLVEYRKKLFLILVVGIAILCNWYTGAIDCAFSFFYLLYEIGLKEYRRKEWKELLYLFFNYVYSMVIGVCLSSFLFIPTAFSLMGGGEGFDMNMLTVAFAANPCNIFQGFIVGAESKTGMASLYCGSIAMIGLICSLFVKQSKRTKLCNILLFVFGFCMLYWQPLRFIFSLFKKVGSHNYRYSYLSIMIIIILAAGFYESQRNKQKTLILSAIFAAAIVYCGSLRDGNSMEQVVLTIIFVVVTYLLLFWQENTLKGSRKQVTLALLILCIGVELACNMYYLLQNYTNARGEQFSSYVKSQEEQIESLKELDQGFYRINQIETYNMRGKRATVNYNEALAYGYNSIDGYTSDPNQMERTVLKKLGYRTRSDSYCITNTSILTTDSLLGVKYILSKEVVPETREVKAIEESNGKKVYENPYVLPMMFAVPQESVTKELTNKNPFNYNNALFSKLTGKKVKLYEKMEYQILKEEDKITYVLDFTEGKNLAYWYVSGRNGFTANAYIGESFYSEVGRSKKIEPNILWLDKKCGETVSLREMNDSSMLNYSTFYTLDLEKWKKVCNDIQAKAAENILIENGAMSCNITSDGKEELFISLPYEDGWKAYVNGEKVEIHFVDEGFMAVPLEQGENTVQFIYNMPGKYIGIVLTLIGMLNVLVLWRRKSVE